MKRTAQLNTGPLALPEVLYALSDPIRLEIVAQLSREGEKTCGTFAVEMPKSSLSHHFQVLRRAGVIASQSSGTSVVNRLRSEELEKQFPGLLKSILQASRKTSSAKAKSGRG